MARIYVDMDGVLCKYHERFLEMIQVEPRNQFPQANYGFFSGLDEIYDAVESINHLAESHDVWILTRPSFHNPMCYAEKRVWVEEHLGYPWVKRLILTPEKGLLIGDYLIDDTPWPTFQGEQVLFGSAKFPNWSSVIVYLDAIQYVKERNIDGAWDD